MVGKLGRDVVEKWRCDDGSLSIPVPQSDMRINVVDRYRHSGERQRRAERPSSCEMREGSVGPLALRIFGSGYIPTPLKLSLYMSLAESRNSFSMHCTTVIQCPSDCSFCVQPRIAQDSWRPTV